MKLELHTISRDKKLYNATATYTDGRVIVRKKSIINIHPGEGFKPSREIVNLLSQADLIDKNGILQQDVEFSSLSTAASFVTGRVANGTMVWKTEDGKYVRYALSEK